jgi:hypothetical protein
LWVYNLNNLATPQKTLPYRMGLAKPIAIAENSENYGKAQSKIRLEAMENSPLFEEEKPIPHFPHSEKNFWAKKSTV